MMHFSESAGWKIERADMLTLERVFYTAWELMGLRLQKDARLSMHPNGFAITLNDGQTLTVGLDKSGLSLTVEEASPA